MSGLYQKKRKRPELNLVPLIDVLVMLVFFAFVTMQFKQATTMNLTLPKVETAGKNEIKGSITISITKDGKVDVDGRATTMENLKATILETKGLTRATVVVLRSDENVPLRLVTQTMDICRQQHLDTIKLQSR